MKHKDYLTSRNITVQEFSDKVGKSRQRIYQVISGDPPGRDLGLAIIRETKNKVTWEDLLNPCTD
jgi:hypothetical protein